MAIKELTKEILKRSLDRLDIQAGDNLLIHSAIQFLGYPVGGLKTIYETIISQITPRGTLVVPTFNFEFARGVEYHPSITPSVNMGVISEFIRQLPEAHRSSHPLQSIAAVGKYAMYLTQNDSPGAFDNGSAFERMLRLDFKCLLLGATINACSIIHYSEQNLEVPYRFWKNFSGKIDGKDKTYRMFARNLDLDPQLDLSLIQKILIERELWSEVEVNYGKLAVFSLSDFKLIADSLLKEDPYVLLSNRQQVLNTLANYSK